MKKVIALSISFLLIVLQLSAQDKSFHFGVKGGVNIAGLKSESGADTDNLTGYHAGVFANFRLPDNFAIQPEVMYSRQGAKYKAGGEHQLEYINVPVLAMYQFNNGIRIQTGPQVSWKTKATYKMPVDGEGEHRGLDELQNDLTDTDFAWTVGAGYVSKFGIGIDARYNAGVKDIANFGHRKNQVWQFGLFYQF